MISSGTVHNWLSRDITLNLNKNKLDLEIDRVAPPAYMWLQVNSHMVPLKPELLWITLRARGNVGYVDPQGQSVISHMHPSYHITRQVMAWHMSMITTLSV